MTFSYICNIHNYSYGNAVNRISYNRIYEKTFAQGLLILLNSSIKLFIKQIKMFLTKPVFTFVLLLHFHLLHCAAASSLMPQQYEASFCKIYYFL